jgi:hyperosmotically inducible periplasmic protein
MNKKNLFFRLLIILALAVFVIAGCTTTKNTGVAIKEGSTAAGKQVGEEAKDVGKTVEDASITSAIKMKFANDELVSASTINVDTNQGHVTLSGTVGSQAELDRAVLLGRSVDGVKSVRSNLTITTRRK